MWFTYEITSFPEKTAGYNLTAYTEGFLRVTIDSLVFLDASGVLLVEFAVVLHKWLLSFEGGSAEFYYSSMDLEEEPILALRFDPDHQYFLPESVWARGEPAPVSVLEAKEAARTYLSSLREELRAKHRVDLDKTLEAAVMEDTG